MSEISENIRLGKIDPNMQELFFSRLIKAFIQELNHNVVLHGDHVPHIIYNTGDDRVWLAEEDYDFSQEPTENTNTQSVYQAVPRCSVRPKAMDVLPDQLSNPHSRGVFEINYDDMIWTVSAETRRMPVKISIELVYVLNNFTEVLELMQYIITHLSFIQTYKFTYLGQTMLASYRVPDSVDNEHQTEIDGKTQDERNPMVTVSIEVESNIPVYEPRTAVETHIITQAVNNLYDDKNTLLDVRLEKTERRLRNPGNAWDGGYGDDIELVDNSGIPNNKIV